MDLKLSNLAKLCKERIDYEPGLQESIAGGSEASWWAKEIEDFEFTPIEIVGTNDLDQKFVDNSKDVIIGRLQYTVNPYNAFHELIKDGVIVINNGTGFLGLSEMSSPSSPVKGMIWISTGGILRFYDGTTIKSVQTI